MAFYDYEPPSGRSAERTAEIAALVDNYGVVGYEYDRTALTVSVRTFRYGITLSPDFDDGVHYVRLEGGLRVVNFDRITNSAMVFDVLAVPGLGERRPGVLRTHIVRDFFSDRPQVNRSNNILFTRVDIVDLFVGSGGFVKAFYPHATAFGEHDRVKHLVRSVDVRPKERGELTIPLAVAIILGEYPAAGIVT